MPGAFNALTARLIEKVRLPRRLCQRRGVDQRDLRRAGYRVDRPHGIRHARRLHRGGREDSGICDADTGFGGPANAARTVQLFERAGLAGMHIEDQEWPKRCGHLAGKSLIACEDMIEKNPRRRRRQDRSGFSADRAHRCAISRRLQRRRRASCAVSRSRRGCDLPRSARIAGGIRGVREGTQIANSQLRPSEVSPLAPYP